MLDVFFYAGHRDLDTALMYANGDTEKMLGELLPPGSDRLARYRHTSRLQRKLTSTQLMLTVN